MKKYQLAHRSPMLACCRHSLWIMFLLGGLVFAASNAVTLNGFLGDKAVVMVKGKPEIYALGQRKHGIKLLKVMDESAVFEIKGKKTTLYMAKAFASNSAIAKKFAAMEKAKSHFVSVKLIFQTWNTMTYEIDYFYDGHDGPYVHLVAKPYFLDNTAEYWQHPYTKVLKGRHTITLTIGTTAEATGSYLSDEVRFQIQWANEKTNGVAAVHRQQLIKEWTPQSQSATSQPL